MHQEAVTLLKKYVDKTFSYADGVSFVASEKLGITSLFSYDRHFAQYAGIKGWRLLR